MQKMHEFILISSPVPCRRREHRRLLNTWCNGSVIQVTSRQLHFLADVQIWSSWVVQFPLILTCVVWWTRAVYACDCLVWLVEAQSLFLLSAQTTTTHLALTYIWTLRYAQKHAHIYSTVSIESFALVLRVRSIMEEYCLIGVNFKMTF